VGVVNTRNAVVGWAVIKGGKYAVKKKAQESGPRARKPHWVAGSLAAAALVAWRVRRRREADTGVE
jgi:MYXO-CTERM domain-containing protein